MSKARVRCDTQPRPSFQHAPSRPSVWLSKAIGTVWCEMKDYIEDKYGHVEKPSYQQLRDWVYEAWDQIDEEFLKGLVDTMPQCCQDGIDANTAKW